MKLFRVILLVFVCVLLVSSSMAIAGEHVAKQGDTWAKVAKATGNTVEQLGKMNKIKNPKDSDPVPAGKKIIFLGKDDLDCAKKWCEKRYKELPYGEGDYAKIYSALQDIKNNRIEYSPDDPYPFGTRFTIILGYAEAWRKK
jgi:LysM repeat protein